MTSAITHGAKTRRPVVLKVFLLVVLMMPALAAMPHNAGAATTATDDFNRANGSLGPNWTDMSDGGLAISSQQVIGTSSGASGDIRTGENYASDQYSQIEITSTQLSGGQWVGAAVRAQNGGQNDVPRPVLLERRRPRLDAVQAPQRRVDPARLDLRHCGALAAGTQLELMAWADTLVILGERRGTDRCRPTPA